MLVAVILSLLFMVFGQKLDDLILLHVPQFAEFQALGGKVRFIFSWAILTLLFAAVYSFVPNKKLKYREQLNGAAFSAAVWNVFSWGFSIYVNIGNAFSLYGSIAIIVISMLWLYFGMYIILIGAYLNQYFHPINVVLWNRKNSKNKSAK